MQKLYARENAVVFLKDGSSVNIQQGSAFDRTDPVVKQHKWLFETIETTSAAPGEMRG